MQPKSPKLLDHIRDAAAFIQEVTRGKSVDDFENDRLLRQAVERNLEIIGEAVGRLARDDEQTAGRITDFRQIIAFRNIPGVLLVLHVKRAILYKLGCS